MISNKIEAVAWDVNGTLIDSEWLRARAVAYTLDYLGIKPDPEISILGLSWDSLWRKIGNPESDFKKFATICTDYYVANTRLLLPRENVLDVVMQIAALGLPQIAVSNSPREIVAANIACLDLQNLFAELVTREDVVSGKSDPEIYLLAASKLGVQPDKILAVEDSPLGATAAYKAGLQTIFWPQDQNMEVESIFHHKRIAKIEKILDIAGLGKTPRLTPEMFNALRTYGLEKYRFEKHWSSR